jgi:hypothetical protein
VVSVGALNSAYFITKNTERWGENIFQTFDSEFYSSWKIPLSALQRYKKKISFKN